MPRCEEAKSVSEEDTKLLRVVSEIKDVKTIRRKDDKSETEAISRHSERLAKESSNTNLIQLQGVKIDLNEIDHVSMPLCIFASKLDLVGWGCYPNNEKPIQSDPSPEFLNSLSFIKKFYPVLNLLVTSLALYKYAPAFTLCSLVLHAPRVPQKQRGCSLLHLLAIRTRCTPSVRKFALPVGARVNLPKLLTTIAAILVTLSDSERI